MTSTPNTLAPREIDDVLTHWRLKALFTRPVGGTANASVVVVGVRGQYVLRRRNPRYCDLGQLTYDHAVLHQLAKLGLPVPKIMRSASGSRWVEHEGAIYEVFYFLDGQAFAPDNLAQVAAAGIALARFHRATESLTPGGQKQWPRYFDPKVSLKSLKEANRLLRSGLPGDLTPYVPEQVANAITHLKGEAERCEKALPDKAYWALPQVIIHGDWHPANLKFQGDEVAGIFDFDWVGRQPRMVDFADGLLFFGSTRDELIDGGDIWSLTQPYRPDLDRMAIFGQAYQQLVPLGPEELRALPDLLRQRALYNRLDPMVRKVPGERKLAFLVAGRLHEPLAWITRHEQELQRGFA